MLINLKNIKYVFLNLDEGEFFPSQKTLVKSLGSDNFLKVIKNDMNQILVAGSISLFKSHDAIQLCRKLTNRKGKK